jgi:hypothetical protein
MALVAKALLITDVFLRGRWKGDAAKLQKIRGMVNRYAPRAAAENVQMRTRRLGRGVSYQFYHLTIYHMK